MTTVMHIHILGICGTFMGSLAVFGQAGRVSGVRFGWGSTPDEHTAGATGVELKRGYSQRIYNPIPDLVVVGNAMSRGIRRWVRAGARAGLCFRP